MRRRDFLTSIAAVAVAAPRRSQAQQSLQTIGYVSSRSAQADTHLVAAFRAGLREIGYLDGQNVRIDSVGRMATTHVMKGWWPISSGSK
jgi:putative ABC transport system substrate-binding protein